MSAKKNLPEDVPPSPPAHPQDPAGPAWVNCSPWVAWLGVVTAGTVIWGLVVLVLALALSR